MWGISCVSVKVQGEGERSRRGLRSPSCPSPQPQTMPLADWIKLSRLPHRPTLSTASQAASGEKGFLSNIAAYRILSTTVSSSARRSLDLFRVRISRQITNSMIKSGCMGR